MTLPANIRVNTSVPFPALVKGSGPITITKVNGIWTVGFSFSQITTQIPSLSSFPTDYVLVYDSIAQTYFKMSLAVFTALITNTYRIVTVAGDVAVVSTDRIILLNKTVGAATNIVLPTSASRNGAPITVKDYKGDANTNNATFVPSGTETIDGFSPANAITNGSALIDINYGKKTLYPLTAGGWYL